MPILVTALFALAGCGDSDRPIRRLIVRELERLPESQRRSTKVSAAEITPLVRDFYHAHGNRPIWVGRRVPAERATAMIAMIEDTPRLGLRADDYGLPRIRRRLAESRVQGRGRPDPEALARLDVGLTRAWLLLGTHLLSGRVRPRSVDRHWHLTGRTGDPAAALARGLERGDVLAPLAELEPQRRDYRELAGAHARYREIAARGGWPAVPEGGPLGPGARGARVARLRQRLAAEGDLRAPGAHVDPYDRALSAAVRRYQRRHGLEPTGAVGPAELETLRPSAAERARQIALNLERLRWESDTAEARVALVNIPEYVLRVHEGDRTTFESRVVVGSDSARTPTFGAALKLMVLNPYWRIPPRIAGSEILEKIKEDRDYLARNNIRVFEGQGKEAREVDPRRVKWKKLDAATFNYRLLQDPGPENSVGHVKFMCPNPHSVYLHDTPATHLFALPDRAFSHGCVRVEKPLAFATHLLEGKPGWDSLRVAAAFDTSHNEVVFLEEPLSVRIVYRTAWVDREGTVQFRKDVYGLDGALDRALGGAGSSDQNSRVSATSNASER